MIEIKLKKTVQTVAGTIKIYTWKGYEIKAYDFGGLPSVTAWSLFHEYGVRCSQTGVFLVSESALMIPVTESDRMLTELQDCAELAVYLEAHWEELI